MFIDRGRRTRRRYIAVMSGMAVAVSVGGNDVMGGDGEVQ